MLAPMPGVVLSPWPWMDKLEHLLAYAVLTQVWLASRRVSTTLGVAIVVYSLMLEAAQGLTHYRAVEGGDVLANVLGVSLSLALTRMWRLRRQPRRDPA